MCEVGQNSTYYVLPGGDYGRSLIEKVTDARKFLEITFDLSRGYFKPAGVYVCNFATRHLDKYSEDETSQVMIVSDSDIPRKYGCGCGADGKL